MSDKFPNVNVLCRFKTNKVVSNNLELKQASQKAHLKLSIFDIEIWLFKNLFGWYGEYKFNNIGLYELFKLI